MIKTNRLELRKIKDIDRKQLMEILTNSEIKETYMIPDYDSLEKYNKLVDRFLELSNNNSHFVVGIYYNDLLIGFINDVDINNEVIELGYVINPQYKGNGYMTEALKASISYLFNNGYGEIIAGAFESNIPSITVMLKSGMNKLERKDIIEYRNKSHVCVYYSIKRKR